MQGDLFARLLPWLGGLLAVAVVGALLMLWTRRMAVGNNPAGQREGFEMDDLRSLLDRGEITPEEYDRARRRMVDRARGHLPADKLSPGRPGKSSGKGR